MPANFPTPEQKQHYGRFGGFSDSEQLDYFFHLTDKDLFLIYSRSKEHTQLGLAIQLGTVRYLGTFLPDSQLHTVPDDVIRYVAAQLNLNPDLWEQYCGGRRATISEHQLLIRQDYGYQEFTIPSIQFSITRWAFTRAWIHDEPPSRLFDLLAIQLKTQKVLLPGLTTMVEFVNHIRYQVAQRMWGRIDRQLTSQHRIQLQSLLISANQKPTDLDRLRDGPTIISPNALKVALERIRELRNFGLSSLDLSWISPDRVKKLARNAGLSKADAIDRLGEPRKWATLAAFVFVYETRAIDDALELFGELIQMKLTRAGNQGEKNRIRTIRDLDFAARHLGNAGRFLLQIDPTQPVILNDVFFHLYPRDRLLESVDMVDELTRPPDDNYFEELLNHYNQFRRFLPSFWHILSFDGLESEHDLLKAVQFLKDLESHQVSLRSKSEKQKIIDTAPAEIVSTIWEPYVYADDGHINLAYYTFCVLLELRNALRRRAVFVAGSDRWGDIRDKLLPEEAWHKVKTQVCRSLQLPTEPSEMIDRFQKQLDSTYLQVANNLPGNMKVNLNTADSRARFHLEPLDALPEPDSLVALRKAVHGLLPRVNIADIIQEVASWTNCLADFTHISEGTIRAKDIELSLSAALLAEATNLGLSPFVDPASFALSRSRLTWSSITTFGLKPLFKPMQNWSQCKIQSL